MDSKTQKLITNKILGTITESENLELKKWLSLNQYNYDLYQKIISSKNIKESFEEFESCDIEKSYLKLRKKNKLYVLKYRIRNIAASILLVTSLGFVVKLLLDTKDENTYNFVNSNIKPGYKKAQLVFSDGETWDLDEKAKQKNQRKKQTDHVKIVENNNTINFSQFKPKNIEENKIKYNLFYTPRGGEHKLILSDGSILWLNAESEVKFPNFFPKNKRQIWVKGEVYIEVAKNKKKPFIVNTTNSKVTVTGTKFNIYSYKDETEKISLVEGGINLLNKKSNFKIKLTPGFQGEITEDTIKVKTVDTTNIIAWTKGKFVFDSAPLSEVLNKLSRWYNFKVFYFNSEVKNIKFSGSLKRRNTIDTILNLIKETSKVDLKLKDSTIVVYKRHN